ncbi:MAG: beta strand repeat-containing protein, partial [Pirellulales bacterium]
ITRDAGVYGTPADLTVGILSAPDLLVRRNGQRVEVVDQGSGDVVGSRRVEVTTGIVINDLSGTDNTVTIDRSGGDFASITGGITFNAGAGVDSLIVLDTIEDDDLSFSDNAILAGGTSIHLAGVENIEIDTSVGGTNRVTLQQGLQTDQYSLTVNGGVFSSTSLTLISDATDQSASIASDNVALTSTSGGASLSVAYSWIDELTVNTAGGVDTISLDVGNLPRQITIDSGAGGDTLTLHGTSDADLFGITSSGIVVDGSVVAVANVEATDLLGYGGADTFEFLGAPTILGSVDGGLGADTLDFSGTDAPPDFELISGGAVDGKTGIGSFLTAGFDNIDALTGTLGTDLVSLPEVVPLLADRSFDPDIVMSAGDQAELDATIAAIEALPAQTGPTLDVRVAVAAGTYTGLDVSLPQGVRLILDGAVGVVIHGASPALTVRSGSVSLSGEITLTNSTDAPTVVVHDGALSLRGVTVEETSAGDQPAIEILGGSVDLGTVFDPGENTINLVGAGVLIRNASANPVSAIGNELLADGQRMDGFEAEDATLHALDVGGGGLVTFDRNVVFVTTDSGSVQRAVGQIEGTRESVMFGGGTIVVVQDQVSMEFDAEDRLLGVVFENGPFIRTEIDLDDPEKTTLAVQGTNTADSISIDVAPSGVGLELTFNGVALATFRSIDKIVAEGGDGDDTIEVSAAVTLPTEIRGGAGNDVLTGGGGNDILEGGDGHDVLSGRDGNDVLSGGSGDDSIFGGEGADALDGGDGNNTVDGGPGPNVPLSASGIRYVSEGKPVDFWFYFVEEPQTIAVDWGDGNQENLTPATGLISLEHAYDDGLYTIVQNVTHADGQVATFEDQVLVNNVAPTATLGVPAEVDEGSQIVASLTSPSDASSADTAAGFEYTFDFGEGYGASSSVNTASYTPADNGTVTVRGKIRDKDGGESQYTALVTVNNVAPTFKAGLGETLLPDVQGSFDRTILFTDPGADVWTGTVIFGDGTGDQSLVIDQVNKAFD